MKKTKISIFSIILCIVLSISVFAARDVSLENDLASDLRELGLFSGVSANNFDLERSPTRTEVLVMLIRVLGEEDEALAGIWSHPFNDVAAWADPYVGYAYTQGLTQGVSATRFGTGTAGAGTYLTFMLRALGYSDTDNLDFSWDNPYDLAKSIGILPDFVDTDTFWRADIVTISYAALNACLKGSEQTLADKLIDAGTFTTEAYREYYHPSKLENTVVTPPEETPSTPTDAMTSAEIYEKCSSAVFYIEISDKSGTPIANGSGFFIHESGIAVTNHHVIDEAASAVAVMANSGDTYTITGVYDYDADGDWAIIQVDGGGVKFPTLEVATTALVGGESIFTIGSPKGLQNSISTGVVSNPSRMIGNVEYIQITAPISSGSSGGALLNEHGQVVGITTATLESGQSLNFARPISCIAGAETAVLRPLPIYDSSSTPNTPSTPSAPVGASIKYHISAGSIVVINGDYAQITLSSDHINIPSDVTVTYSIVSSNTEIASVEWGEEEDQPWSIYIYGHKPGTTTLTVSNDYTSDVATVAITVTQPVSNITYAASVNSVSVNAGTSTQFYLTTTETGVPLTYDLTYYVESGNSNIAAVKWSDDSTTQPWGITVTGVSAGTTYVRISNNYNSEVLDIPVTVGSNVSSTQSAWNRLKNNLISYGEYSYEYRTYTFDKWVGSDYYNVAYDLDYGDICIGGIFTLENADVSIFMYLDSNNEVYLACTVEFANGYEINGAGYINASSFNANSYISFTSYDGTESDRSSFNTVAAGAACDFLKGYDTYLRGTYNNVSAYDLGFRSIY